MPYRPVVCYTLALPRSFQQEVTLSWPLQRLLSAGSNISYLSPINTAEMKWHRQCHRLPESKECKGGAFFNLYGTRLDLDSEIYKHNVNMQHAGRMVLLLLRCCIFKTDCTWLQYRLTHQQVSACSQLRHTLSSPYITMLFNLVQLKLNTYDCIAF